MKNHFKCCDMKKNYNNLLLFLPLILFGFNSCKNDGNQAAQSRTPPAPVVKVQPAGMGSMASFVEITGSVQANIISVVSAPVDGVIESLSARENQYVEKGKIIAVINPGDRMALIANNQVAIQNLENKLEGAGRDSDDYEKLLQELEKAKANLEYSKTIYQTVPVVCPMDGLVTQRWLDRGSQVGAREQIITISDMSSLVIKAEMNERYFESVSQGKRLPVILNAYPNDTLTGIISLIYPQVDPVTRSIRFDIRLQNFRKKLLPGMMASIKIPVQVNENAISVPEQAVLTSPDSKRFLFVVTPDSIARRKVVETGMISGNRLEVRKGLSESELVVVEGQEMLRDSLKVRIMK